MVRHEQAVLEEPRRLLLDPSRRRVRGEVFRSVTFVGRYPMTAAEFVLRSERHPETDQTWDAVLWFEEGEPCTSGRRVRFSRHPS